jgi:hypothetical protein
MNSEPGPPDGPQAESDQHAGRRVIPAGDSERGDGCQPERASPGATAVHTRDRGSFVEIHALA